ncbi:MAG: acetyl-CoA carboxylase biotin carboxylase subunit [Candidatus Omnitrophica bacterium]|nr:acetyl-CoA carboxylase biotin carboxylase subunit [Candidatus Omnitrophota bacterium]MCM8802537.1 acetyl-CoA carboxylase biotin carboxylase subunit [Candidatus Omnitrophota bacterium]
MIKKLFVANRGEIALRIIRGCKELEIPVVIGYSEGDRYSLPVFLADERICIGPANPKESYLNIPSIISSIEITGADAVHPGYGFLSENIQFVEICNATRIIFVGPTAENLRMMGDKSLAKKIAQKAKVPVIPGYEENNLKKALSHAQKIGFPIMIKASAGGGGRGMRKVYTIEEFEKMWYTCQEEAKISFGEGSLYIEKFIERPRHIEIQVLCDNKGNIYVFPERDCSIQRRHQKLIEESPSPFVDDRLRKKLQKYAKRIVKYIKYRNAGTIEFLVDQDKNPYFIEMNTRIQVEHPVTECVTGIDLVKSQIKIADNSKLDFSQKDIKINYYSIECRINAEDPENNFMPSPGKIKKLVLPSGPGIRVDSHIYEGYYVPPYYDSLIAKIISYGKTRQEAIERMKRALEEIVINGIKTTVPLYKKIISHPIFLSGRYYVGFVDKIVSEGEQKEVVKW